jgi:hypothetical protein
MDRGERVQTICRRVFPVVADDDDDDERENERRTNAFVQAYVTQ